MQSLIGVLLDNTVFISSLDVCDLVTCVQTATAYKLTGYMEIVCSKKHAAAAPVIGCFYFVDGLIIDAVVQPHARVRASDATSAQNALLTLLEVGLGISEPTCGFVVLHAEDAIRSRPVCLNAPQTVSFLLNHIISLENSLKSNPPPLTVHANVVEHCSDIR